MTARMICAREAPSVRSRPNSRVRCATVIEKVLKMMNAPDDERDVGEDQQEGAQEAEVAFQVRGVLGGLLLPRAHRHGARQHRSQPVAQLAGRHAGLGGHVDLVVAPRLADDPLRLGRVRIAAPAPPKDWPPPNLRMPTIV